MSRPAGLTADQKVPSAQFQLLRPNINAGNRSYFSLVLSAQMIPSREKTQTIVRRVLFAASLLLIQPAGIFIQMEVLGEQRRAMMGLVVFIWSFSQTFLLLGFWSATRVAVLDKWRGIARLIVYVSCCMAGLLLANLVAEKATLFESGFAARGFHEFAGKFFGSAVTTLIVLATASWIMLPLSTAFRLRLATASERSDYPKRISTLGILSFITFAAVIIGFVGILSHDDVPLRTQFHGRTRVNAIGIYFVNWFIILIPKSVGFAVLLIALAKRWWLAPFAVVVATVVDVTGRFLVIPALFAVPIDSIPSLAWVSEAGIYSILCGAMLVATILGIRIEAFGSVPNQNAPKKPPIDQDATCEVGDSA